jgi:putative RNA 2'-phosphotransferase
MGLIFSFSVVRSSLFIGVCPASMNNEERTTENEERLLNRSAGYQTMDTQRLVKVSKFLSKHLRHQPERLGLTLEPGGWVGVGDLLAACARHDFAVSRDELAEVVASSDKQRFAFDETGDRIRANQGHSVEVDLQLERVTPPDVLYHGTPQKNVEIILRDGLQKMARHHVHLSHDVATATKVGARRGKPVILVVDAAGMHGAGHSFFCSANGVWLVESVPPRYLRLLESIRPPPENAAP